jgi:hypothetical protein
MKPRAFKIDAAITERYIHQHNAHKKSPLNSEI